MALIPVNARIAAPAADDIAVREERFDDFVARENLLDASLGVHRRRKSSERLREGRLPARGLALSAQDGARLVGTVRLWHVDAGGQPALLLGPLAVAASHRSRGVGGRLMREAIARARALGHGAILLVGDAPYYARFGFQLAPAALAMPGPFERERFLALELRPGALDGARGVLAPTGERIARRNGEAIKRAA